MQPLYYVAGMVAQGRGETYKNGHQRAKHYVLETVTVLMAKQMQGRIFVGYDQPAPIHAAPALAYLEAYAVTEALWSFAYQQHCQRIYGTHG